MAKSIAANSLYNFILKFFRLIVPLLVSSHVIQTLDQQLYAEFQSASTWLDFALIFGVFGVTVYGIREGARVRDDKEKAKKLFSSLFSLNLVTNSVVLLIYSAVVFFSLESISRTIYLVLGLKLFANIFLVEWLNEAMENYRFITIKTILVRIFYAVLIFGFIHEPDDVVRYVVIIILTDLLNNLASFFYIKKRMPISFHDLEIKKHIVPLISMMVISNVNILYTQLDKMLLDVTVGSMAVATYKIPQDITVIISNLLSSVVMVAVPRLAYYHGNDQENSYRQLLDQSYHSFMLLVFPACMGFACLAQEIMHAYTKGTAYDAAIPVLILFAFRTVENSVYTVCANQIFFVYNQEKYLIRMLLICGLLNVALNYTLIATGFFTPVTAIATTILSEIILMCILFQFIRKRLKIPFRFFTKTNVKYMLLSLTFIPITLAVRGLGLETSLQSILLGSLLTAGIIIVICMALYFGVLLLIRDTTMCFLTQKAIQMFFGRFRRNK
ncbi:MAG: oligosaccharide flippase family protein [Candidatus Merdivicinus sp.]|jgi:O-antigen/teichoic acid export membrane protein